MNTITKIALITTMGLGIASFAGAENASVLVVPTGLTVTAGETLSATVELLTQANNVCVIMGDISFSNLSCQSISVNNGILGQSAPSCQNGHFVVGIPKCTTEAKTLFNISARASNPGSAAITVSNVKTIGQNGTIVPSTLLSANYTVQGVLSTSTNQGGTSTSTGQTSTPSPESPTGPALTPLNILDQNSAGVSQAQGSKSFLASLKDTVFSKDTAWILGIVALLAIAYYVTKNYFGKNSSGQ